MASRDVSRDVEFSIRLALGTAQPSSAPSIKTTAQAVKIFFRILGIISPRA
jgi:hypothetical protein